MIYRLENTIQNYAWGSAVLMPEFLGRPNPEQKPWAELWMGAHPKAPSHARPADNSGGEIALDRLVAAEPDAFLGVKTARAFDGLPFLLKLLAAGTPLSIQCHPDLPRARAGFERENSRGIPLAADERNYRDANHKPEIILALTPFTALCGLRPAGEIIRFFESLPVPEFTALARALKKNAGEESLKSFLRTLLSSPREAAAKWIEAVKKHCVSRADNAGILEFQTFLRLADFYPEDSGAFAPFYLNLVSLKPGEALFLGPGELHSYLEGLGMELMANSDNVLRAGLTPKHKDVEELLSVVSCRTAEPEILLPAAEKRGGFVINAYPRRAREFTLSALFPAAGAAAEAVQDTTGPEILFCGRGDFTLGAGGVSARLVSGDSLFIPASEKTYTLSGEGVLYRAEVPA